MEEHMKNGFGVECIRDGNNFIFNIGQWKNNKMHGNGRVVTENGLLEIGIFEDGLIEKSL